MPYSAPKHCPAGHPSYRGSRCPMCEHARKVAVDERRPNARARGYDSKWRRESQAFLAQPQNRFCACGCGREATMVDHKVSHKGDMKLFWDRSNWQPMYGGCNTRKAIRCEGAFRKGGGREFVGSS